MDEETKAAFDSLVARMNDQFERVLDAVTTLQADFLNTKAFLIEDALVTSRRVMSIEDRLTALERGRRP